MSNVSPATLERLKKFSVSEKYKQLSSATQQRLGKYIEDNDTASDEIVQKSRQTKEPSIIPTSTYFKEENDLKQKEKENFLDILKRQTQTATISGIPSAIAGIRPEEALKTAEPVAKMAGQIVGGKAGGLLGTIAATTGIEALTQAQEMVAGERKKFSLKELGTEALVTGLTEGVFRLPAAAMYKKLRLFDKMHKSGNELGQLAAQVESKGIMTKADSLLKVITDNTEKVLDQSGPVGAVLRRWKRILANTDELSFQQVRQLKQQLGDAVSFVSEKIPKNQAMNKAAKMIGGQLKTIVDDIAKQANVKDFLKQSDEFAKLAKKAGPAGARTLQGTLTGVGVRGTIGTAVGMATGNPMAGLLTTGALLEAGNPAAQRFLYKLLEKSGAGRAATVGTTSLLRELEKGSRQQ